MRKLMMLVLVVLLSSCTHTIKDEAVIEKVENNYSEDYLYKITVANCDFHSFEGRIEILTNIRYNVGDTINLVKK